jgi:ribonuclease HI
MARASGTWKTKGLSLGQGKGVFDAELVGASKALETAEQLGYEDPIRILLDSQVAIAWLQDNTADPGQGWAIQAQDIAQKAREPNDVKSLSNGSRATKAY